MQSIKKLASLLSTLIFLFQFIWISNTYAASQTVTSTFDISCPAAITIDAKTGNILYEKNKDEKRYPASTTKIMTAILAIENCKLDDTAIVHASAINAIPPGYQNSNFLVESSYPIGELLNMLLVHSSNLAGYVLAEHIGGSVSNFSSMMNTKAKELGCTNTHFTNPSGIHDSNHYSSVHDLALIACYAMKNQTFRNLVKQPFCTFTTNKAKIYYRSTNLLLDKESTYYYPYAIGVKTGYTKEAGNCLVAAARKDNIEIISVVLGGNIDESEYSQRYTDTIHLLNYSFDQYYTKQLVKKGSVVKEIVISNATKETKSLSIVASDDISILTTKGAENTKLVPDIKIVSPLLAPIQKGEKVGSIQYLVDGTIYISDLIAGNTVEESKEIDLIFKIILIISALILFAILLHLTFEKKE